MELPAGCGDWGCIATAELKAVGWTRRRIEAACRSGHLVKVRAGIYVAADAFAERTSREQHLTRIAAEQRALNGNWLAARRSGAVVYALPLIGSDPVVPQLVLPREKGRAEGRSRHARIGAVAPEDRSSLQGVGVVSRARVVVDIARQETFRNGVVVADAALRQGTTRRELEECVGRMRRWPGSARARAVISFADGAAESPLESISRVAFRELSLPAPELQVDVYAAGCHVARVDHLWRNTNTIGEADGLTKYGVDEESVRAALRAERRRMEWLEDLGFEVVRWGWQDAWRPAGVLDVKLARAFERGQRQALDPRVSLVPTSAPVLRPAA
jgi:hypothetical protein